VAAVFSTAASSAPGSTGTLAAGAIAAGAFAAAAAGFLAAGGAAVKRNGFEPADGSSLDDFFPAGAAFFGGTAFCWGAAFCCGAAGTADFSGARGLVSGVVVAGVADFSPPAPVAGSAGVSAAGVSEPSSGFASDPLSFDGRTSALNWVALFFS
jgi:hypothetical protein